MVTIQCPVSEGNDRTETRGPARWRGSPMGGKVLLWRGSGGEGPQGITSFCTCPGWCFSGAHPSPLAGSPKGCWAHGHQA